MLLTRNSGRKGKHFLFDRQANAQKMCGMRGLQTLRPVIRNISSDTSTRWTARQKVPCRRGNTGFR